MPDSGETPGETPSRDTPRDWQRARIVRQGNPRLSERQVRWALERYHDANLDERLTQRELAVRLQVSRETVARVVRGECWSHVYAGFMRERHNDQ